jgi:methylaspartate mutase sigma subunit
MSTWTVDQAGHLDRRARTPATSPAVLDVIITATASDAHTWNLIFLQLFIEELGHRVRNLGPCVPEAAVAEACRAHRPDLLVVSSVNGHGLGDGLRLIRTVRADPTAAATVAVIGGKLGIRDDPDADGTDQLLRAGFAAVFPDTGQSTAALRAFVQALPRVHAR